MTQDKELLLQDLCARLPYKIMVKVNDNDVDLIIGLDNTLDENGVATGLCVNIKLLFPL